MRTASSWTRRIIIGHKSASYSKKVGLAISKYHYDMVIHGAAGAAVALIKNLYCFFTKRALECPLPVSAPQKLPDYMRPTSTWLLKDHELARLQDDIARMYKAVDILDHHKEDLAMYRYETASQLIASQRLGYIPTDDGQNEERTPTGQVTELQVKTLRRDLPTL